MAQAKVNDVPVAGNPYPVPFTFKDKPIRTILEDGTLWVVAKDVCSALTIPWKGGDTLRSIPTDWVALRKLRTPDGSNTESPHPKKGGLRGDITVISEPAVYKLAFRSNKPEADEFTNWVASEVLPAIRKTGQYQAHPPTGALSPEQQQHIRNLVAARAKVLPKGAGFPQIWERVKNKFGVARYQDIPAVKFEAVVEYLLKMVIEPPKALPAAPVEDLETKAIANQSAYRPAMRQIEDAIMAASTQLRVIEDALCKAKREADDSNITNDTSLAQQSANMVYARCDAIRALMKELEPLAALGFAGICNHLELKNARARLHGIEKESKGQYKAGDMLYRWKF